MAVSEKWAGDDPRGTGQAFFDDILDFVRSEEEILEDGMSDFECEDEYDENLLVWWNKYLISISNALSYITDSHV